MCIKIKLVVYEGFSPTQNHIWIQKNDAKFCII